jgi:hypothetical protein
MRIVGRRSAATADRCVCEQRSPNKRMQLTTAAVMPAAGHPACQPRRS